MLNVRFTHPIKLKLYYRYIIYGINYNIHLYCNVCRLYTV